MQQICMMTSGPPTIRVIIQQEAAVNEAHLGMHLCDGLAPLEMLRGWVGFRTDRNKVYNHTYTRIPNKMA